MMLELLFHPERNTWIYKLGGDRRIKIILGQPQPVTGVTGIKLYLWGENGWMFVMENWERPECEGPHQIPENFDRPFFDEEFLNKSIEYAIKFIDG